MDGFVRPIDRLTRVGIKVILSTYLLKTENKRRGGKNGKDLVFEEL